MRKAIIIFLFLLVNVWFALGWTPPPPITPPDVVPDAVAMGLQILSGPTPAAGGSCSASPYVSQTSYDTGSPVMEADAGKYFGGVRAHESGAGDICKICFISPSINGVITSFTYHAEIWTVDGSEEDMVAQVGADSDGLSGTAINTGGEDAEFCFEWDTATPPTVSASTHYHFVVTHDGAASGTNYIKLGISTSESGMDGGRGVWHNDGVYEGGNSTLDMYTKIYKTE